MAAKNGSALQVPETGKFAKGNAGRRKGNVNKTTVTAKEMLLESLGLAGGAEYLAARAKDPHTQNAYMTLLGKLLPAIRDINAEVRHSYADLIEASFASQAEITDAEVVSDDDD